jgi:hypothetical protein
MPRSDAQRRRDADAKKRKDGYVPVHFWIPAEDAEMVKAFVKGVCENKSRSTARIPPTEN